MDPLSSGSYFFQNTKINTENKAKVSMAGAKRVPVAVAASKPLLRSRTALGDIGNKVSEQSRIPLKKVTYLPGPVILKKPIF